MIIVAAGNWYHCKVYNPGFAGRMPYVTFEVLHCSGIKDGAEATWSRDRDGLGPVTCAVEAMYLMIGGEHAV